MKTLATLAAVSVLTLAGAAIAQTTPAQPPAAATQDQASQPQRGPRGPRLTPTDLEALTDARMAAIQAGLKLSPQQQQLWTPVEQALRTMATQRATRFQERRDQMEARRRGETQQQQPRDLSQDLQERAQRLTQSAQNLTTLSDAMKPFWASLSEDQKRLLPVLIRQGRGEGRHGMRMGMWDHHGHGPMREGMMGHGPVQR